MGSHLLLFLPLLLSLVVAGGKASPPGEKYWHSVLPRTPFPQVLSQPKILKDDSIAYGKPKHSQKASLQDDDSVPSNDLSETAKDATLPDGVQASIDMLKLVKDLHKTYASAKPKNSQQGTLQYDDSAPSKSMSLETGKDITIIYQKPRNLLKMNHDLNVPSNRFSRTYLQGRLKKSQKMSPEFVDSVPNKELSKIHKDSDLPQAKKSDKKAIQDRTIFYRYNDLHPGKKMTLLFTNAGNKVDFLPRQVAETMPFSADKLPAILNGFSIDPESADAEVIKDTIEDCENHQREEVFKHCATSVESLVDQNVARLGRNIRVLSTPEGKRQEYTVLAGTKRISDDRVIVCHRERYPYAVYYCHEINHTEVYTVPLMGADGTKLKAVTICHKDTAAWNPDYIAFQTLKTVPGQPFCHFLSSNALVWFQTKELGHETLAYLHNILNQGAFDI